MPLNSSLRQQAPAFIKIPAGRQDKSIVVLGAGFGGLRAATLIAREIKRRGLEKRCTVTLIDRNDYHTYTPTLYEAATTSKETANYLQIKNIVTFPIAEIIKGLPITFIKDAVTAIDLINGDIHCSQKILKFDYLVLAPGSETNYFDIPGLKENALTLKSFIDALKIRDNIFELAQSKKRGIKILIGGGGSTGVELAGEIKEWLCQLEEELGQCEATVTIVESAPTILPGFDERIIKLVIRRLKKIGVSIITNEIITEARPDKIILKSGKELPHDLLIWAGGVRAPDFIAGLPLKIEKRGRVEVISKLECLPQTPDLRLYGKIYGIGDAVCIYDKKTGKPMPGVARAALNQATIAAHNVICDIESRAIHKEYQTKNYPYVIPVGGKWALAKIGPLVIWGFWGWLLKGLVELRYLASILSIWKSVRIWLKGLLIFIKNDRLG